MERYNPNYKVGLSDEQVEERINNNLVNYNDAPPTKTIGQIIRSNFFTYFNFLNLVLGGAIIAAGIYGGELWDSIKNCTFMGVIIFNSIISIVQEVISKKTIDKLSVLAASKVVTIRNGKETNLSIDELVLDDVVKLSLGNQVVTDSVILNGAVEVNESFLTGEVDPILKNVGDTILSGSFIVSGSAYARVDHIGKDNYISKISSEAKYDKKVNSIIMNSFEKILKVLSIVIVPVGAMLLVNNLYVTNYDITKSVFTTVAALIGMIPEGLLLLTSSVMAVSVVRLARYKVLVQQLYCIETLARVDVICLDKTGTITEGAMELSNVICEDGINEGAMNELLSNLAYAFDNSNATMDAIRDKYPNKGMWTVTDKLEFSSSRKFSAVTFDNRGTFYFGAPEFVLRTDFNNYRAKIESYSEYRVLVIAYNKGELTKTPSNLRVLGFLLIQDKIRKEAPDTLKYFKKQGVTVKIISGDNFVTVCNIAKRAGLKDVKGMDATLLTDDNIEESLEKYDVFGRVTPDQKKLIIKTLQKNGHTVAMTGDGVNDVLALKQSDCSIAMASGSDAAKNVSQIVLLDSNFASMPEVVAEGRRTINNVERSASLLLIKTIFTAILVVVCIFMKSEYFYMPIHLSLITACTISIPSFILALEPNHDLVNGNFLFKVFAKSLPAALTVVFNIVIVSAFASVFNLSYSLQSSICVIITTITGLYYLFKICYPINIYRGSLLGIMFFGFVYCLFFYPEFFNILPLDKVSFLITFVLTITCFYMYKIINYAVTLIFHQFDETIKIESDIYKVN